MKILRKVLNCPTKCDINHNDNVSNVQYKLPLNKYQSR